MLPVIPGTGGIDEGDTPQPACIPISAPHPAPRRSVAPRPRSVGAFSACWRNR